MQINSDLNLVFPLRTQEVDQTDPRDPSKTIRVAVPLVFAYHTPIGSDTFQAHYRIIASTKASIFGRGVAYAADVGPRIAGLALRDAGSIDAAEWGIENQAPVLLAEIKRLTHVLVANESQSGFDMLPIDAAIARKVIDPEEWSEAESFLTFFTCGYAMALRSNREAVGRASALVLAGSMTSLPPMEYAASLLTSTSGETSGPIAQ